MQFINLDPDWPVPSGWPLAAPVEKFTFPGGEAQVKILPSIQTPTSVLIRHRLNSSHAIMELLLAADAVRRKYRDSSVTAYIPYIPYGRQDRAMNPGEAFSLKVFADVLKTGNFKRVMTLDPHSDVTAALLDPLTIIEPKYLNAVRDDLKTTPYLLVAPDGGSLKKIHQHIPYLEYEGPLVTATKHRDTKTGKITHTTIDYPYEDVRDKTFLIADDICDGGATFIALAKLLKDLGARSVLLAVSHGIFSKGEEELAKVIDQIYTTTSIKDDESTLIKRFPL